MKMPDIRKRVEEDRGLLKRIQLHIPGFAGYRRKEDLRASDNLLRVQLAKRLGEVRDGLEECRRVLVAEYDTDELEDIGGLVKLLTGIVQWAEVYYVQRNPFDGKFGSKQPYQFRDRDFGMVNLRVFGEFRYLVKDCSTFINRFVGTENYHTAEEVEGRIREQIVVLAYDAIGHMKDRGMGVADISTNLTTIEQIVIQKSKDHFEMYGLEIQKISSIYISIPEEVQKAVDAKASMTVLGTDYMGYQTGQAMRDAAKNPSSGALAGPR